MEIFNKMPLPNTILLLSLLFLFFFLKLVVVVAILSHWHIDEKHNALGETLTLVVLQLFKCVAYMCRIHYRSIHCRLVYAIHGSIFFHDANEPNECTWK